MNNEETEKVLRDTIEYANQEIKKSKKMYLKNFLIIFGILILLLIIYLLVFKYEIPVKYNQNIIEVNIPEDQGLDIKINLSNYNQAKALLVQVDEDIYDLYINVTQTLATKVFDDTDKSNNLLRVGNSMIIDFQSNQLIGFLPNGNNNESIKHIYYIDNLSNKIMTMNDNELMNYSNKTLIWETK